MLNYAYAVLIAQTQIRLIVEGYDPTIGVMHEKKALRGINPGFALDHMEPMRPVVDRAVLQLINSMTFTGADFSIQHDGVCRMNPELARRVAQLALELCDSLDGSRWAGTHAGKALPLVSGPANGVTIKPMR
jgi:CRISP-associated protein Cas1